MLSGLIVWLGTVTGLKLRALWMVRPAGWRRVYLRRRQVLQRGLLILIRVVGRLMSSLTLRATLWIGDLCTP